jgi:hypothetical protein
LGEVNIIQRCAKGFGMAKHPLPFYGLGANGLHGMASGLKGLAGQEQFFVSELLGGCHHYNMCHGWTLSIAK